MELLKKIDGIEVFTLDSEGEMRRFEVADPGGKYFLIFGVTPDGERIDGAKARAIPGPIYTRLCRARNDVVNEVRAEQRQAKAYRQGNPPG